MSNELIYFMLDVRAKFLHEIENIWLSTFRINSKGGMNKSEVENYVFGSIVPLYPCAKNKCGKIFMLKVDSGLGQFHCILLARLIHLDLVLYPGMPNATGVTQ